MKNRIVRIAKILISLLLMYLLLQQIDYEEIRHCLQNTSIDGMIVVVVAYLVSIVINAIKWHVLLPETEIGFLIGVSFRAQLYSTVLPGQLFGEASKVTVWTNRKEDVSEVTASVIFDRITGLIGQIIIGILGIFASKKTAKIDYKWILIVALVAGLVGIYILSEKHVSYVIRKIISLIEKVNKKIAIKCIEFYETWFFFSTRNMVLVKSVMWGIINQMIGIIALWYLSARIGVEVSIIDYCWILSLMSVILLLPISFAGIGLRDTSMVSMLSLFNVSIGNSLIISTSMLLGQVIAAGVGAIYTLKSSIQKG